MDEADFITNCFTYAKQGLAFVCLECTANNILISESECIAFEIDCNDETNPCTSCETGYIAKDAICQIGLENCLEYSDELLSLF